MTIGYGPKAGSSISGFEKTELRGLDQHLEGVTKTLYLVKDASTRGSPNIGYDPADPPTKDLRLRMLKGFLSVEHDIINEEVKTLKLFADPGEVSYGNPTDGITKEFTFLTDPGSIQTGFIGQSPASCDFILDPLQGSLVLSQFMHGYTRSFWLTATVGDTEFRVGGDLGADPKELLLDAPLGTLFCGVATDSPTKDLWWVGDPGVLKTGQRFGEDPDPGGDPGDSSFFLPPHATLTKNLFLDRPCGQLQHGYPLGYFTNVFEYEKSFVRYDIPQQLQTAYIYGTERRSLLAALGDYWEDYFDDIESLAVISTSAATLSSEVYSRLLEMVLSASIDSVPTRHPTKFNLVVFAEEDFVTKHNSDGDVGLYFLPATGLEYIQLLTSSLFEPDVVLEHGTHFEVDAKGVYFYVDLFNDQNIFESAYLAGPAHGRKMLLWAMNIQHESTMVADKFGHLVHHEALDAETYRKTVRALMEYYTSAKSVNGIETILNVLAGLPYTKSNEEKVEAIHGLDKDQSRVSGSETPVFFRVRTSKNSYIVPAANTELQVSVGEYLSRKTLIAKTHFVADYITDPDWYNGARFPHELVHGYGDHLIGARMYPDGTEWEQRLYELMDHVLKYNILYVYTYYSARENSLCDSLYLDILKTIQPGLPVYLYPLVDSILWE